MGNVDFLFLSLPFSLFLPLPPSLQVPRCCYWGRNNFGTKFSCLAFVFNICVEMFISSSFCENFRETRHSHVSRNIFRFFFSIPNDPNYRKMKVKTVFEGSTYISSRNTSFCCIFYEENDIRTERTWE